MKLWLPGLALFAVCFGAQAENYRIVQSPTQKLDIWIDDIADNSPKSWCARELPLRIVANGDKKSPCSTVLCRVWARCSKTSAARWRWCAGN